MKLQHVVTTATLGKLSGRCFAALLTALLIRTLLASPAVAQDPVPQPVPPQDEPIALTGGTIHTVSDGVIENGTILFEEGEITAVGTDVNLPAGTREVDISDREVYPGLIDGFSRMGIYEVGAVDVSVDISETGDINPNVRPKIAFNAESRHIGVARANGVLVTVTTPSGGLISGKSSAMMMEGWSWEDMALAPQVGMQIDWPEPETQTSPWAFAQQDEEEETYGDKLRRLREVFDEARAYKIAQQASGQSDAPRHESDSRWEAMIPVLEGELPVVVEANELRQLQDAISFAKEQDIELIILGGRDAPLVSERLVREEIPVILGSVLDFPNRDWQPYDEIYRLPHKLQEAGVEFGIAGSSSAPYANRLPYEAGIAATHGLTREEALRAVTLSPAEIYGFDDRVGSLEEGKDATLMITDGHPVDYDTTIEQAYIQGREIDMKGAHKLFYEKYREKVRQYGE